MFAADLVYQRGGRSALARDIGEAYQNRAAMMDETVKAAVRAEKNYKGVGEKVATPV